MNKISKLLSLQFSNGEGDVSDNSVFEEIINKMPNLISIKDTEGKYVMVNHAFADLAGVNKSSIIGKDDLELGLFLNPDQIMQGDQDVFRSGSKRHIPLEPFTDKYGNLFWFKTDKIPLINKEGVVEQLAIVSVDITKKVAQEQQLQKSEQRYKSIFENNYSGIIVVDKDLTIFNKNKAFNSLVGLEYGYLGLDDLKNYIATVDTKDLKDLLNGVISKNYEYFDLRLQLKKDNSEETVETLCFVRGLYSQSGTFTEAVVTFQDITSQIKSQKALEESESRFRVIVQSATEALLLLDYDSQTYIDANDKASEIFGYSYEEILNLKLGDLSPINQATGEDSTIKSKDLMKSAMAGEKVVYEWIVRRKDGRLFPCEVRLVKLPYRDKSIIRTSVIDITDRKKAEHLLNLEKLKLEETNSQLLNVNDRLENQTKQLQEFAYIASHNLRSPVGNIKALLDFYANDKSEANLDLMLEKLGVVSDDLMDTIHDLAQVVRIKNEVSQERTTIELQKIFDKTLDSLSQVIQEKKAVITTNLEESSIIYAPKTYIESIFLNLISNAVKYAKEDVAPEIELTFKKAPEGIKINIKDNGSGIDLERHKTKLFGLRKTFHKNRDARGVGLFITKAQIESMGGTIEIQSEVNVGTEFEITLPNSMLKK